MTRTISIFLFVISGFGTVVSADRPNVIVIMSDDQGGGDYGFMDNSLIQTPQLDAMRVRSGYLSNFYVSPVCAPTRASLMTGRYNYRTRCIDTYVGRAMMDPDEVTIAELLRDAGYQTGIYGKWHLGDNYPMRAMDQGFQDSLVHRGGGIGQPSDPFGAERKYTDPTLFKNGIETPTKGYCTDIYFHAAMEFIQQNVKAEKSFFTYIATNAPHGPFHDVPMKLYEQYRQVDFSPIIINKNLNPKRLKAENDKLARIAAMITNIDENVGRLFKTLDKLQVRKNTIVIYLNDNGPNTERFVGNMRGRKSMVDDGGIRSPLLFHWPAKVLATAESNAVCAHIDLLPTILEACQVTPPNDLRLDGRSFMGLLTKSDFAWPDRQLVFQTHRGDQPHRFHHFAIHEGPWKLVHPSGFGKESFEGEPKFQLYNLLDDPRQKNELSDTHPDVVQRLESGYETWFDDVSSTRRNNYDPPRIVVGTKHELTSVLTRQDWRHSDGRPWAPDSNGVWLLESLEPGDYELELILAAEHPAGRATISAGDTRTSLDIPAVQRRGHLAKITVPAGKFTLDVDVDYNGKVQGPHQVILRRQ